MITKYASVAAFSLALTAAVGVFGAVSAFAQTSNSGYDMLNAQSANPSNGASIYSSYSATGTTVNGSTSTNASGTATPTNVNGTSGTVNVNRSTTVTPGVPNTGAGGDAPVNLAVLIISGLVVAAGMTYVTLRLAL